MKQKKLILAALIVVLLAASVGGTIAFLSIKTGTVENTFTPQQVTCDIHESFTNNTKTSITVENTCDIPVYIRVALIPYWQDAEGNVAGKASWTPSFTPANGWVKDGDYYYYPTAIDPDDSTPSLVGSEGIVLPAPDANGNKAVLVIAAEAIQAQGMGATTAQAAFAAADDK